MQQRFAPADIPPEAVAALAPAFARSDVLEAQDWVQRCRDDLAQLHRAGDLWAITEVQETKQGRALHIVALAGPFAQDFVDAMEAWGRSVGCTRSFFTGRSGWVRRMRDYRLRTVTLEKEI